MSYFNHRFNVLFLIEGTNYEYKDSIVYRKNVLKESIQEDIDNVVFLASSRDVEIIERVISGPIKCGQSSKFF